MTEVSLPSVPPTKYPNIDNTTWRLFGFHESDLKLDRRWQLHSKVDGHVYTQDERFSAALWVLKHSYHHSRRLLHKICPLILLIDILVIRHHCKKAYLDPDWARHFVKKCSHQVSDSTAHATLAGSL